MLRFLEDADLVEQERDDINRILSPDRKPICEFPFTVDTTSGRPEDEAGCSYGHGSSSESLRGESELCSSDTRQSPVVSSTCGTVSDSRRQISASSGSSASRDHQNRPSVQPFYDMNSMRKNDCQVNGNMPPPTLIAGYTTFSVVPPGAACFSPQFGSQAGHMFPFGVVSPHQWTYPMLQPPYANPPVQQFLLPQVVPRPTGQIPVAPMRMASTTTATAPLYPPPPMCGPIYVPPPRPFIHNADFCHTTQNIHYSMDSMGSAASYTGTAIIQEDVSATLPRANAHQRTSPSDEYHQPASSISTAPEPTAAYSQRDSTASPSQLDEDHNRQSCDSPTIVIEADQNAAALASRQRASALLNASSTAITDSAVTSSAVPSAADDGSSSGADAASVPSTAANYCSPAQSPQMAENANASNGNASNKPLSPVLPARETDTSALDIYYDAEDKPVQQASPPPNASELNSGNVADGATTAASEVEKASSGSVAGAAAAESDDAAASSSSMTKQKSWASLFRNTAAANSAIVKKIDSDVENSQKLEDESARHRSHSQPLDASSQSGDVVAVERDSAALRLAEVLRNTEFLNRGPTFVLRGIVNRGNWCYVNATLQALMACPPFYHFLRNLSSFVPRVHTSTPLLDAFVKLAMEFPLIDRTGRVTNRPPQPFDPTYLYAIITRLRSDASFKGRQEDAEEFLLQVFNVLHDEMVNCLSLLEKDRSDPSSRELSVNGDVDDADANEWQQVGPGRKAAVTRQTKYTQSPLSQLFLGQLRYGLSQPGAKESANLEPFYTLPLDVQSNNVKDLLGALQAFTSKETLKSFAGKNKTEVDATRRITFHELPRVMIFQLKYFVYGDDGLKKIMKPIEYTMDLMLDRDVLFSRKSASASARQYKLFAVVFHHGEKAEGGHYTVDIFHGGQWLHVDDTKITSVNNDHVLAFQAPRVPYLLFYRRWDSGTSDSQQQQSSR